MNENTPIKGTFYDSYPKNGRTVFMYFVSGTSDALARYKEIKGENYREIKGKPVEYTTTFQGESVNMAMTVNDKVVFKNSGIDKVNSVINSESRRGNGLMAQAIATEAARSIVGNLLGTAPAAPAATTAPATSEPVQERVEEEDLQDG